MASNLKLSGDMRKADDITLKLITYEVTINLDVFSTFMKNRIFSNPNCTCIKRGVAPSEGNPMSESTLRSQSISEQAADIARYSASVEDLETLSCFLHFQETRLSPKNMHHPVVDLRVSGQSAQSASE